MSHPVRRAALLTPLLVVGIALNGCGVADEQARPGVAAEVDGTTISLAGLDDQVEATCEFLDGAGEGQVAFPRTSVRRLTFETAVRRVAAEKVLDELGLELPAAYDAQAADLRQQYADAPDDQARAMGDGDVDRLYYAAAATVIGAELLGDQAAPADDEEAQSAAATRGNEEIQAWLLEHDVDLNPTFGLTLDDAGSFAADDGLSIPVSAAAVAAQADAGIDLFGADFEQREGAAEGLPADQVCGPTA